MDISGKEKKTKKQFLVSAQRHNPRKSRQESRYLDKGGVFKDLVGVTDEFKLLHYSDRGIQVQNDSCGCDTEIDLSKEERFINKEKDRGNGRLVCKGAAPPCEPSPQGTNRSNEDFGPLSNSLVLHRHKMALTLPLLPEFQLYHVSSRW